MIHEVTMSAQMEKDRAGAGCIQQIANSCINDIHECASFPKTGDTNFDGKAPYFYPTSHVFTPNEVTQLEATGMVGKILLKNIMNTPEMMARKRFRQKLITTQVKNQILLKRSRLIMTSLQN